MHMPESHGRGTMMRKKKGRKKREKKRERSTKQLWIDKEREKHHAQARGMMLAR
jgi:hypothetical protein